MSWIEQLDNANKAIWIAGLKKLAEEVKEIRDQYMAKGIQKAIDQRDFQERLRMKRAELQGRGHSEEDIGKEIQRLTENEHKRVEAIAREHIKESVGAINTLDTLGRDFDALGAESVAPTTADQSSSTRS